MLSMGGRVGRVHLLPAALLVWAALVPITLVTGAALVAAPLVAWTVLGIVLGLLLLQTPGALWIGAAVLAAACSRLLVAASLAPSVINFFHFPLTLGAVVVGALHPTGGTTVAPALVKGSAVLLLVSGLSWVLNGGEPLRPVLAWVVFAEPFLLLYALDRFAPSPRALRFLLGLVVGIAAIQFPLAVWQALTLGQDDFVQGTFIGMGAGAHVAGAVALIGVLIATARALAEPRLSNRLPWILLASLLLPIPALADAKQSIIAFLVAFSWLIGTAALGQKGRLLIAAPLLALALWIGLASYPRGENRPDLELLVEAIGGKAQTLAIITQKMAADAGGWLFGLGPGNSVSRVGLMGLEGYIKPDSPVSSLGLGAGTVTQEIWDLTFSYWLTSASSVWSGFSSWLGLFGDFGIIGAASYLWMSRVIWRTLRRPGVWQAQAARAVLIMAGVLGALYSWLEEPGFTLLVALVAGLGLLATKHDDVPLDHPARP